MAGFGLLFESHFLVVFGHNLPEEPLGFLAYALPPLAARHSPGVVLLAVLAQSDLAHDALEQVLDVVMQGGRGLDEFAVEHDSAGPALYGRRRKNVTQCHKIYHFKPIDTSNILTSLS